MLEYLPHYLCSFCSCRAYCSQELPRVDCDFFTLIHFILLMYKNLFIKTLRLRMAKILRPYQEVHKVEIYPILHLSIFFFYVRSRCTVLSAVVYVLDEKELGYQICFLNLQFMLWNLIKTS